MPQSTDPGATGTAHRLKVAANDMVRYHLSPLTLLEAVAFVAALLLGWKEVAVAILAWHALRMIVMAVRHRRDSEIGDPG
jgi:hypothetical protein